MKAIKVLCIHGIGGKERTEVAQKWKDNWEKAIKAKTTENTIIDFLDFDSVFKEQSATLKNYVDLLRDAIFGYKKEEKGVIEDFKNDFPGMVAEFFKYPEVRNKLRILLINVLNQKEYDAIFAHSLGSLICYDFFRTQLNNTKYKSITLITAGSQLGHENLPDFRPIQFLNLKKWYNLNNRRDMAFASNKIGTSANNCIDSDTEFGVPFMSSHSGEKYIQNSKNEIWKEIMN